MFHGAPIRKFVTSVHVGLFWRSRFTSSYNFIAKYIDPMVSRNKTLSMSTMYTTNIHPFSQLSNRIQIASLHIFMHWLHNWYACIRIFGPIDIKQLRSYLPTTLSGLVPLGLGRLSIMWGHILANTTWNSPITNPNVHNLIRKVGIM